MEGWRVAVRRSTSFDLLSQDFLKTFLSLNNRWVSYRSHRFSRWVWWAVQPPLDTVSPHPRQAQRPSFDKERKQELFKTTFRGSLSCFVSLWTLMNCWCCCQLGDLKASFFPITATLPLIKRFCRPVSCFEKHVFSSLPLYNRQSQRLLWNWQIGCGHKSDQKQISSQAQYHIKTCLKHRRGCYIRRNRILIFLGGMCW